MKKTFYFIRHGRTDFNQKGIVQGRGINSSINEEGKRQAERFFDHYKDIAFDKIYVSGLKRTYQTVEPFVKNKNIPFERVEDLDEISWGEYEGLELNDKILADFDHYLGSWRKGELDLGPEGGESPNELYKRVKKGLDFIVENSSGTNFLVCTHGRTLRSIMCHVTGSPLSQMDEFPHENTCLYIAEHDGTGFSLKKHFCTQHISNE